MMKSAMKSLSYGLAVLLGCLAAIGLSTNDLWSATADPPAPEAPPEPTEQSAAVSPVSPATLLARMEAMESNLAALGARLQTLEHAGAVAMTTHTAEPPANVSQVQDALYPAEEPPPPDEEDDPDARYREMQDLLARQTPDPGWETMAATDIATTFERVAPAGTVLETVACTGRICRVDLRHEAGATLDDLLLSDALVPWPHRGVAHAIDEERSVLFLVSEEP